MVAMLREAGKTSVAAAAKRTRSASRRCTPGASSSVSCSPGDVKRLKALEAENVKLKKLLAERVLEVICSRGEQPKVVSPQMRRERAAFLQEHGPVGQTRLRTVGWGDPASAWP